MLRSAFRKGASALATLSVLSLAASAAPQQNPGQDQGRQGGASKEQGHVRRSESLQKIRGILDNWNSKSWDDILSDNVTLTLKVADVRRSDSGDISMVSLQREVQGKEAVKKALTDLNKNFRTETTIRSEMISGDEAVLLGDVTATGQTKSGQKTDESQQKSAGPREQQKGDQGRQGKQGSDESPQGGAQETPSKSAPVAIHLHFNDSDKVDRMVIACLNPGAMRQSGMDSKQLQQK